MCNFDQSEGQWYPEEVTEELVGYCEYCCNSIYENDSHLILWNEEGIMICDKHCLYSYLGIEEV